MRFLALLVVLAAACARSPETATPNAPTATAIPSAPVDETEPATPPTRDPPTAPPSDERNATAPPPTHVDENGDRVPISFVVGDLVATLEAGGAPEGEVTARILTWLVEVDDRPLVIDRAILWVHRHPKSGPDSWQLAHFYRHPLDGPPGDTPWHVAKVYDAPYVGQAVFTKAPSDRDLDDFLAATWWKFQPSDDFRFLDAGINTKAWTLAVGKAPKYRYP